MILTSGLQSNDGPPTMTSTTSAVTNQPMLTMDKSKSPTFIPNHVGTKSMGSADNKQTESTLTPSESLPLNFSGDYAVGVAVGGLLMVVVVAAVIVIALLVVKRGQARKIPEGEEML